MKKIVSFTMVVVLLFGMTGSFASATDPLGGDIIIYRCGFPRAD